MRQLNVNLHALRPAEQKRLFKSRESVYPALKHVAFTVFLFEAVCSC